YEAGLLSSRKYPDQVARLIACCERCRRGHGAKQCRGWALTTERDDPFAFAPLEIDGVSIRPELSADLDFGRSSGGTKADWEGAPLAQGVTTLELFQVSNETLLERYHVDLANVGQEGPVWHLQYGGNSVGSQQVHTHWLAYPRFPVIPADLVLMA